MSIFCRHQTFYQLCHKLPPPSTFMSCHPLDLETLLYDNRKRHWGRLLILPNANHNAQEQNQRKLITQAFIWGQKCHNLAVQRFGFTVVSVRVDASRHRRSHHLFSLGHFEIKLQRCQLFSNTDPLLLSCHSWHWKRNKPYRNGKKPTFPIYSYKQK